MDDSTGIVNEARQHAADLGDQAQAKVKQEAFAQAEAAKAAAAEKITQAANAAETVAEQFDPASAQAEAMQRVADQIEDVAAKLRHADVRQLTDGVTDVARQNPLLFLGGAAIVGFAAARFLKARDPHRAAAGGPDPWAGTLQGDGSALAQMNQDQTNG
jgi:hypothetical protein